MERQSNVEYFVDESGGIIVIRATGTPTSAAFAETLQEIRNCVKDAETFNRLIDLRRYTGHYDFHHIEEFAQSRKRPEQNPPNTVRVAILTHDAHERARLAGVAILFPDVAFDYFTRYREATEWLSKR